MDLKSGIEKQGHVPALECEATFISDLAETMIVSFPYVGGSVPCQFQTFKLQVFSTTIHTCIVVFHQNILFIVLF